MLGLPPRAEYQCEFEELIWRTSGAPYPWTAAVLSSHLLCSKVPDLAAAGTCHIPYRKVVWPDRMCLLQNIYGFNEGETWRVPF